MKKRIITRMALAFAVGALTLLGVAYCLHAHLLYQLSALALPQQQAVAALVWQGALHSAICTALVLAVVLGVAVYLLKQLVQKDLSRLLEGAQRGLRGDASAPIVTETLPEFALLGKHIGAMGAGVSCVAGRLSDVLGQIDPPIAVYEYQLELNRVFASDNIAVMFDLFPAQLSLALTNCSTFAQLVEGVKAYPIKGMANVYDLNNRGEHFLRIESITDAKGTCGVVVDVTGDVMEMRKIEYERTHDSLIHVYNRRAFFSQLAYFTGAENANRHSAVMCIDIENLKEINVAYGHAAGDEAIRQTVRTIKQIDTPNKMVARMGGDEFMVVIYGVRTKEALLLHITALEAACDALAIVQQGQSVPVRLCAGYLLCAGSGLEYAACAKKAAEAQWQARRSAVQFMAYQPMQ